MKTLKFSAYLLLSGFLLLNASCKDDDKSTPTPSGNNSGFPSNGSYVKGTVSTFKQDGTAVEMAFEFTSNYFTPQYDEVSGEVVGYLLKDLSSLTSNTNAASVEISNLDSLPQASGAIIDLQLSVAQEIAPGELFISNTSHLSPAMVITGYKYNKADRSITANFIHTDIGGGSNGEDVTIQGSFKLVGIQQVVQRPAK